MANYRDSLRYGFVLFGSLTTTVSKWDASGKIPQRAVDGGLIG